MNLPKRKPTRLKGYDYSKAGAYFVTICTHNRKCILSHIVGAIHESPLQWHRSVLSKIIGYLKMNVSKKIHLMNLDEKIWQRGYHDHIIRGEADYEKIWNYIDTKVLRWELDCFYNNEKRNKKHTATMAVCFLNY